MPIQLSKVKPSKYDRRDFIYKSQNIKLEQSVDLRSWDSPIEDQESIGSCVGASIVAAYELLLKKKYPEKFVDLSKLYTYYHARLLEDSETSDDGVIRIRNGVKGVQKFGICAETLWPYQTGLTTIQPKLECYIDAWPRKILTYQSVSSIGDALEVLSTGIPIVFGLNIFSNFALLNSSNAVVSEPTDEEGQYLSGSHAMTLVGYDAALKWFIVKNSYGSDWGDKGYCYVPFDYYTQYAFDKWFFNID